MIRTHGRMQPRLRQHKGLLPFECIPNCLWYSNAKERRGSLLPRQRDDADLVLSWGFSALDLPVHHPVHFQWHHHASAGKTASLSACFLALKVCAAPPVLCRFPPKGHWPACLVRCRPTHQCCPTERVVLAILADAEGIPVARMCQWKHPGFLAKTFGHFQVLCLEALGPIFDPARPYPVLPHGISYPQHYKAARHAGRASVPLVVGRLAIVQYYNYAPVALWHFLRSLPSSVAPAPCHFVASVVQ